MSRSLLHWVGFDSHPHGHDHGDAVDGAHHVHVHGAIDPAVATTARGIWAVKWSFVVLAIAAALQFAVVAASGSVALLADAIHNIADAATAVPLWIAFLFAHRKANSRFTYGYGKVEDLAGAIVVLVIFSSVVVAAWQALHRLLHPHPLNHLGVLAIAGVVGFVGNEIAAVLRIRVGREMESAALIADGYHARADGFTSLAVVVGAAGVWLGFPLADPIVGLLIAATILVIVWQSAGAVLTRLLDGVDPKVVAEIRHAAEHLPEIRELLDVRARWIGHQLHARADIAIAATLSVGDSIALADRFRAQVVKHLPALASFHVALAENREAASHNEDRQEDCVMRHHHLTLAAALMAFVLSMAALLALVLGRQWMWFGAGTAAAILAAHITLHWLAVGLGGATLAAYGLGWLHGDTAEGNATAPRTTGTVIHWAWRYDLLLWLISLGRESAFRQKQIDLAGIAPGETVLDVGCGTGTLAIAAKRRVGDSGRVYGIDASPEMIARARKKASKAGLELKFEAAAIEALPFPDATFDVVLSTVMLHHLPDQARQQGLREIRRILKPGGRLFAVDFGGSVSERHSRVGRHSNHAHFDILQLIPELKEVGLSGVSSGKVGFRDLWFVSSTAPTG